jgi:hypothetical protein
MATVELAEPPTEPRALELWLQHAAGHILFEDVRRYAFEKIDPTLSADARAAAEKGIDDALYGLMMVIDGVTGSIRSGRHLVCIEFFARLVERINDRDGGVLSEVDLKNGDGMCMGYHGWRDGDFGENAVVVPRSKPGAPQ